MKKSMQTFTTGNIHKMMHGVLNYDRSNFVQKCKHLEGV